MALEIPTRDGILLLAASNEDLALTLARVGERPAMGQTTRMTDDQAHQLRMALDAHLDRRHT